MADRNPSRSRALGTKVLFAALIALKEAGGQLPSNEVMSKVEKMVDLDEWDREIYEKTGYIRWQSILHFYTIGCIKAGYLVKQKGIWFITKEGETALSLGEKGFMDSVTKAYREWKKAIDTTSLDEKDPEEVSSVTDTREMAIDEVEQKALQGLQRYVDSKNAYEFQDLVAALLRGMGYYTPFVAPRGKDGGVDIIAYRDPLGTTSPRMKVQVKHRAGSASVQEIRQLMGLLQKDGDIGIFVSSGGFTPDAKVTARTSHVHVELIDFERLITLWREFYPKLADEDKSRMPLLAVHFLAPE